MTRARYTKPESILCYADGARGIYIPQHFAKTIKREHVTGVSAEDYVILEAGPDHEWYWETWEFVVDNARVCLADHTYSLWQNGDLFLYCDALMTDEEHENLFGMPRD